MEYKQLLGYMVYDKDSIELGKIVRIDRLPHILTKKIVPHIVIQVKISLLKRLNITFDVGEIGRIESNKVWLKINNDHFKERLEREILLYEEKQRYRRYVRTR